MNETFILFNKELQYVPCVCTPHNFQETAISTKKHKKWVIFRFLELLKIHKSSFKNILKLVFHQNISKAIKKSLNLNQYSKVTNGVCHPHGPIDYCALQVTLVTIVAADRDHALCVVTETSLFQPRESDLLRDRPPWAIFEGCYFGFKSQFVHNWMDWLNFLGRTFRPQILLGFEHRLHGKTPSRLFMMYLWSKTDEWPPFIHSFIE